MTPCAHRHRRHRGHKQISTIVIFPDPLAKMLKSKTPSPVSSPSINESALPSTSPTSPDNSNDFVDIEKGLHERLSVDEEEAAVALVEIKHDIDGHSLLNSSDMNASFKQVPRCIPRQLLRRS